MARLDLDTSFAHAVTLVEWAERLADAGLLPVQRLDVQIAVLASQEVGVVCVGEWCLTTLCDGAQSIPLLFSTATGQCKGGSRQ